MLPWVDRIGRRFLLLSGSIICMVLHFAVAGTMADWGHYVDAVNGNNNLHWVIHGNAAKGVIAMSYIFIGFYGFTWVSSFTVRNLFSMLIKQGPAAWIYCSEVFPLKFRAKGVGISTATNWIFNFALAFFVPPAFTNITWKTYIVFGVFCATMTIQVFFMFPETAGRSLEEVDMLFERNVKPWKTGKLRGGFAEQVEQHKEKPVHEEHV